MALSFSTCLLTAARDTPNWLAISSPDTYPWGFCISSFKIIRELVANGLGVSFLYEAVVGQDAQFGHFCCPPLTGSHELNVVYLKNTPAARYAHAFLSSHP